MQVLDCIPAFTLSQLTVSVEVCPFLSFASLPFNPIRLALLVAWFYLWVYLVQRVHFSPLVPKSCKVYANVVTLFTGPALPLTLFILDTVKKTRQSRDSFLAVLRRQIRHALRASSVAAVLPGQARPPNRVPDRGVPWTWTSTELAWRPRARL